MRKDMMFKYLLVGIFIYLVNLFYQMPHRLYRFVLVMIFVVALGTLIEKLYFYMLIRKKTGLFGRLVIIVPISILFMLLFRYMTDQVKGYHLYVIILTTIGAVILDQVNYQVYKYNHSQVNNKLKDIKEHVSHLE